ncbi:glycoside hydrolase superfamily [Gongronella butleri]|nr:glycoside hydrolase superfamily [Gongronella butleri]
MRAKLPRYEYINLDSGWHKDMDNFGRWLFRSDLFPSGLAALSKHLASNGHKLGVYLLPGIPKAAVEGGCRIKGHDVSLSEYCPNRLQGNAFSGTTFMPERYDDVLQQYFDSIAELFASWGIRYVKLDGCGPGSGDEVVPSLAPDCRAVLDMMARSFRRYDVWIELSWYLDHRFASDWQRIGNGARVFTDIESYSPKSLTTTARVLARWYYTRQWAGLTEVGGKNGFFVDLDAVVVGMTTPWDGKCIDGLYNDDIRRTYISFWALTSSVFCIGSDPRLLPEKYLEMLHHPIILDIQQSGIMAQPLPYYSDPWSYRQVWWKQLDEKQAVVGLFNIVNPSGGRAAPESVRSAATSDAKSTIPSRFQVGFRIADVLNGARAASIKDVWLNEELGIFQGNFTTILYAGQCKLVLVCR